MNVEKLKEVLTRERMLAIEDIEYFPAEVVDIHKGIATIETGYVALFQPGDPIGILIGNGYRFLGTVIDSWENVLTVVLDKDISLHEKSFIQIFDYEPLIGYDLQLKLLEYMTGENADVDVYNLNALDLFFSDVSLKELNFYDVQDVRDVKHGFKLDESQVRALEAALALDNNELLLIIGPPGTGKTRVIAKIAYELSLRGEKVLIASHTNRAVDNAIELLPVDLALRVGRPEKVLESVKPYLLGPKTRERAGEELLEIENDIMKWIKYLRSYKEDFKEAKNKFERETYTKIITKVKDEIKKLYKERGEFIKNYSEELIGNVKIIGSTLVKSQLSPLTGTYFNTVIIDEASQASILLALLGMIKGEKWIIVGDHKQLLPIFKSIDDASMQENLSSFVHLLKKYPHRSLWLENHYRSNYLIIDFVAKHVYENKIRPVEKCKYRKLKLDAKPKYDFLDPDKPIVFIHVEGIERFEDKSRYNIEEINAVSEVIEELAKCKIPKESIGIISPYKAQRNRIANKLDTIGYKVEIGTVDSFQGREKDIIIFTITATSKDGLEFVSDEHRLNVAFTRPRYKLITIGNGKTIHKYAKNSLLHKFLEYAYNLKAIWDYKERKWMTSQTP